MDERFSHFSDIQPEQSKQEPAGSAKKLLLAIITLAFLVRGDSRDVENHQEEVQPVRINVRTVTEPIPQTIPTDTSSIKIAVRAVKDIEAAAELTEIDSIDNQPISAEMIQLPGWTETVPLLPQTFGSFKDQSGRTITLTSEKDPDVPALEGDYREILTNIEGQKQPLMDPSRKYPILVNQGALWNWDDQQKSLNLTFHHLRPVGLIYDLTYQWNGQSMALVDSNVNQPKTGENTNPGNYQELQATAHSNIHPTHHKLELEKAKIFWKLARHSDWEAIRQIYRKHGIKNESYIDEYIVELQKQLQEHNELLARNINYNYFEYRHSNRPYFLLTEHIGVNGLDLKNF